MTKHEAIKKHIKECRRIDVIKRFMDSNSDASIKECEDNILILKLVIQALEKQIPKKPKSEGEFFRIQRCPACEKVIGFSQKYCDGCGQKLDWPEG